MLLLASQVWNPPAFLLDALTVLLLSFIQNSNWLKSLKALYSTKILFWGVLIYTVITTSVQTICSFIVSSWTSPLNSRLGYLNISLRWLKGTTKCFCYYSVSQSCLTLCNPVDYSMPGFPVLRYLLEFAQTHVHWDGDTIQLSHPLSSPSFPALNLSHHQSFPMKSAFLIRCIIKWEYSKLHLCDFIRRSNQSILKEINHRYSLEGLLLKLQYFGHLMQRADLLEKTLMLGKTEGKRRRGWQRMRWLDSLTDSMDMS